MRAGYALLDCFNDFFECCGIVHRQIGQHLAVELDALGVHFAHEFRISHAVAAGCGVDTLDPQATELAFLVLAIAVSVRKTLFDGVFGDRPYVSP